MAPLSALRGPARRIPTVLAAALVALAVAASAGASGGPAKLQLHQTSKGTILVNSRGFTLYAFTLDSRNRDNCVKSSACITIWPPMTTVGRPIAGPGVRASLIGTIRLKSGKQQVTYAGHPLYTYLEDKRPGQTTYVNILQFNGRWPAMNAAGQEVK